MPKKAKKQPERDHMLAMLPERFQHLFRHMAQNAKDLAPLIDKRLELTAFASLTDSHSYQDRLLMRVKSFILQVEQVNYVATHFTADALAPAAPAKPIGAKVKAAQKKAKKGVKK